MQPIGLIVCEKYSSGSVSHWNFPEMGPWVYFMKHNAQQKVQFNSCGMEMARKDGEHL